MTPPVDEEAVEQLRHAVFGNGDPGLDENVRTLIRENQQLADRITKLEETIEKFLRTLLFSGLSAVAALLWQVVVWALSKGAAPV